MCDTCGCGAPDEGYTLSKPSDEKNETAKNQEHENHSHGHGHGHGNTIEVNTPVLSNNNLLAERNRGYFEAKEIKAFNMVSSPGSGKTTILEKIIPLIKNDEVCVIEGDQQTLNDAKRIEQTGANVIQVNTGNGCHLDADMVNHAVKELAPSNGSLLFIENVGNLVCPALFDLGEKSRIVIMSVTEGADKPLKYPNMFETSQLCIINKTDLLPYVDFDVEQFKKYALKVNHHLDFIELSATKGDGMDKLIDWLLS